MGVSWSDEVDEILTGDLAAGLAYLTPAKGVVIVPMAPLGLRDREAGTVTLTTSLGLWKKLDRVRRNPGVAVAYHAREHGFSDRPGFVLVQGRASFSPTPDRAWLEIQLPQASGRESGPLGVAKPLHRLEQIGRRFGKDPSTTSRPADPQHSRAEKL